MEGLEIKEKDFSAAIDNKDFRIDSQFYTKEPLKNPILEYDKIGNHIVKAQYGISISMNEEGIGYPIYRMNEIHNMMCDNDVSKSADISKNELETFVLNDRDVLFNRTNSFEWVGRTGLYKKTDTKDFVFASYLVRFIPNQETLLPEYLTTFLNSKYGVWDIKRRARQSINQTNVNPEEVKEIEFPLLSLSFQKILKSCFDNAISKNIQSQSKYQEAENLLLETLGLKDFEPNKEPVNIKSFKESFGSSGRLDAEYYSPKFEEEDKIFEQYSNGFKLFKDLLESYEKGKLMDYSEDNSNNNSKPYVLINNLRGEEYGYFTLSQNGVYCTKDDFLIVGDGSNSGFVGTDVEGFVGSTLIRIKLKKDLEINKYSLLCILRYYFERLNYFKTGSGVPHLDKSILDNLRIPLLDKTTQNKFTDLFAGNLFLKNQSEQLLDLAKTAVEKAIEENEQEATNYINEKLTELKITINHA